MRKTTYPKDRKCTVCRKVFPLTFEYFHRVKTPIFKGFTYKCHACDNLRKRYPKRAEYNKNYAKLSLVLAPEKVEARRLATLAVKRGSLKKKPCEVCNDVKSEAHPVAL